MIRGDESGWREEEEQGERKGDAAETKDVEEEEEMEDGRRKVGGRCLEIRKEIRGGDGEEGGGGGGKVWKGRRYSVWERKTG